MWAQYILSDAMPARIQATTGTMVDPVVMAGAGKGQAELPDDGNYTHVDASQIPPVFSYVDPGASS